MYPSLTCLYNCCYDGGAFMFFFFVLISQFGGLLERLISIYCMEKQKCRRQFSHNLAIFMKGAKAAYSTSS